MTACWSMLTVSDSLPPCVRLFAYSIWCSTCLNYVGDACVNEGRQDTLRMTSSVLAPYPKVQSDQRLGGTRQAVRHCQICLLLPLLLLWLLSKNKESCHVHFDLLNVIHRQLTTIVTMKSPAVWPSFVSCKYL